MSPDQLQRATGCSAPTAARLAPPLSAACAFYDITTPKRIAAFLAQVGHESGSFRYVSEIWGPTDAQRRYEGRKDLGNAQPGDGERYKGRGYIQTTGRYNYAKTRDRLRERFKDVPDFEAHPDALEQEQWACLSACDYWNSRNLNALADNDQFEQITRRINGGLNGQPDRQARWEKAKAVFDVPTVAQPKEKEMPLPAIALAVLPAIIEAIPKLGKLFGSGSEVAERNVKAAEVALTVVKNAVGATNEQEAMEMVKTDPEKAAVAQKAIEDNWFMLAEAGGGGIDGARKADAETRKAGDMVHSPSFWMALATLPLVYLIVGSVVGLWGVAWSDDVRSAIANGVIGMVLGGLVGYYFGQTTSKNRTPANE